jgi:predicted dehydrogenase
LIYKELGAGSACKLLTEPAETKGFNKMKKINWGIIGTGPIAHKFAHDLDLEGNTNIVAICSRTVKNADKFAKEFDIPEKYTSVDEMVANPLIDAVYIAIPHTIHMESSITCMNAGKAVLCEKPMALNLSQVSKMMEVSRNNNVLLMEGIWSYFFPGINKVSELISDGSIGKLKMIEAGFCFSTDAGPECRLLNKDLGGGALLDVGIYTISMSQLVTGSYPVQIDGKAIMGETGVDIYNSLTLVYPDDIMATLTSAAMVNGKRNVVIYGTDGRIEIHEPFWRPNKITLNIYSKKSSETVFEFDNEGNGFVYEIRAFNQAIRDGETEVDTVSHEKTKQNFRIMDTLRKQWGLKYPSEDG